MLGQRYDFDQDIVYLDMRLLKLGDYEVALVRRLLYLAESLQKV